MTRRFVAQASRSPATSPPWISLLAAVQLAMLVLGCRQSEPLGRLQFPDSPESGSGGSAAAAASRQARPALRFDPPQLKPVLFLGSYTVQSMRNARRQEEVRLAWDAAGSAHRLQSVAFTAPDEPPVDRRNEDLLQDGVHHGRGADGRWWLYPDLEDWQRRTSQDLEAWQLLAGALGLVARPEAGEGDGAGVDERRGPGAGEGRAGVGTATATAAAAAAGSAASSPAAAATRYRLRSARPGAGDGELLWSDEQRTLLRVLIVATGDEGQQVRYEAGLHEAGSQAIGVPRVEPGEVRSPDRPRTYARIKEQLQSLGVGGGK
ncbi:MAG: hypothetical protein FJ125_02980 [Deltaproteobacteria bacterium]|nr:hypothetical protein [Deltaproteobacteria bacterium]